MNEKTLFESVMDSHKANRLFELSLKDSICKAFYEKYGYELETKSIHIQNHRSEYYGNSLKITTQFHIYDCNYKPVNYIFIIDDISCELKRG